MACSDLLLLLILLHMCLNVNSLVIFILSTLLFLIWYVFWGRNGSPDVAKKLSPRAARPLKLEPDSSSSPFSANNGTPKDKSPNVPDRRSPRSPISEKKRRSIITELESLVSPLQEELKKAKHQVTLSETSKKLVKQEAEESRKQLQEVSSKRQETQNQVLEDYASLKLGESNVKEEVSSLRCVERLRAALEAAAKRVQEGNVEASSRLRIQDELQSELKTAKSKIDKLKARLVAKKTELKFISEEKDNIDLLLRKKNQNETEAEAEMKQLREVIEKLKADLMDKETELQIITDENETLKSDIHKRETDVQDVLMKLGIAMQEADKSSKRAVRVTEQLDATQASNSEMETELDKLKARLVDKETELKFISEEKDNLYLLLKKNQKETAELNQLMEKLKADLMDKEIQLLIVSDENETLKSDIHKREADVQDALMKLVVAMEEADKSSKRAVRITEQLDATQASNSEMKTELRELKVQSNQWKKAAETATAMLSAGNNDNQTNSPYSKNMEVEVQRRKMGMRLRRLLFCGRRPRN